MKAKWQRVSRQDKTQKQIYKRHEPWKVCRKRNTSFLQALYCVFHSSYVQIFNQSTYFWKACNFCAFHNIKDLIISWPWETRGNIIVCARMCACTHACAPYCAVCFLLKEIIYWLLSYHIPRMVLIFSSFLLLRKESCWRCILPDQAIWTE